jgi:uncharacterized protein (TIGR03435 family)
MLRAVLLALLPIATCHAQSFDVASLKPSPSDGGLININHGSLNHGAVALTNVTLSECTQFAYGLISDDQVDGPVWKRDRHIRFDIAAKTSPDASLDQVRPMMQHLLAERFHLAVHRAQKPIAHLELSVARKGLKMPVSPAGAVRVPSTYKLGRVIYDQMSMHTLTVQLSRLLRQPVLDLTGLTSLYDVRLEWAPDDAPPADAAAVPLPDIFQAVEEELGLHLESKKTPLDVIAIDRAEQVPIAN